MDKDKNVHKGHRQRMKKKYIENGLELFENHEVLELLLYYCYPMVDTNEIAHKMLNEYGTLSNLFDSSPQEIARRCKVTENVAVLVSLIPSLSKRYMSDKWDKKVVLDSSAKAAEFAISLFVGKNYECFYIVCLDNQRKFLYAPLVSEGTINETPIYLRIIVELCLKFQASSIFLAHNHPSGSLEPSTSDKEATKKIYTALELIGIEVIDHIIVAGEDYYSFAENSVIFLG